METFQTKIESIFNEIYEEREKQNTKWGEQNHQSVDPLLLKRESERMCEEYEIPSENRAKFICQNAAKYGNITWSHIVVEELAEVVSCKDENLRREELVQLAACVVAWIESIDRNK